MASVIPSADAIDSERSVRELSRAELGHLDAPYGAEFAESAFFALELPFRALRGPGFERLCYHLLLAQGKKPRFFGVSGQAQYGIDLIVHDGRECEVYQCKNVAGYGSRHLATDLEKFEREWLVERFDLPRPTKIVLCCSDYLYERGDWDKAKAAFSTRTRVRVEEWTRDMLETWLKRAPDIVADLFGDDVAERFCGRDDWNDGLFRPLLPGNGDRDVERYLALRTEQRVARDAGIEEKFAEILEGGRRILLEGLSGAGKTMAALDLGVATGRRVFFVRIDEAFEEQALFRGVKERCARDTLFVIDDCQRNWSAVERADRRWRQALADVDCKLVFTAQTVPGDGEAYGGGMIDLLEELRGVHATITLVPGAAHYRAVLEKASSPLARISDTDLARLRGLTGGSLAVLDLIMTTGTISSTTSSSVENCASIVLLHWFKQRAPTAPCLQAFAAVAQFDLTIPAGPAWPEPEAATYAAAIRRLVHRTGDYQRGIEPSWRFSHPTAAEAIFRALVAVSVSGSWQLHASAYLAEHFCEVAKTPERFARDFGLFMRNRLLLGDDTAVKVGVLARPEIQKCLEPYLRRGPLRLLSLATFLTKSLGNDNPYAVWLAERLTGIFSGAVSMRAEDLPILGYALRTLSTVPQAGQLSFARDSRPEAIVRLIRTRGTLLGLVGVLVYLPAGLAADLIALLRARFENRRG